MSKEPDLWQMPEHFVVWDRAPGPTRIFAAHRINYFIQLLLKIHSQPKKKNG